MINVSELLSLHDYNYLNQTSMLSTYEERLLELKNKIHKTINEESYYLEKTMIYGIFFSIVFEGDDVEVEPIVIKSNLSPLGMDILVGYFQCVASDIDQGVCLSEVFIAELLVKYFEAEIIDIKCLDNKLEEILCLGIHHNWELIVCEFHDELRKVELNCGFRNDIKKFIKNYK